MNEKNLQLRALFELSVLTKTLVTLPNEHLRAVGKTELLVEYSKKHDIPIIVGYDYEQQYLSEKGANVIAYNQPLGLKGMRFPNGILVEESMSSENVKDILNDGIEIKGGFLSLFGKKEE